MKLMIKRYYPRNWEFSDRNGIIVEGKQRIRMAERGKDKFQSRDNSEITKQLRRSAEYYPGQEIFLRQKIFTRPSRKFANFPPTR